MISQPTGTAQFYKSLLRLILSVSLIAVSGCGGGRASNPTEASKPSASASSANAPTTASTTKTAPAESKKTASKVVGDRLSGPTDTASLTPKTAQEPSPFRFTEITKDSGIDFVHVSGMDEKRYFPFQDNPSKVAQPSCTSMSAKNVVLHIVKDQL